MLAQLERRFHGVSLAPGTCAGERDGDLGKGRDRVMAGASWNNVIKGDLVVVGTGWNEMIYGDLVVVGVGWNKMIVWRSCGGWGRLEEMRD